MVTTSTEDNDCKEGMTVTYKKEPVAPTTSPIFIFFPPVDFYLGYEY
jgi:hypothetical protein